MAADLKVFSVNAEGVIYWALMESWDIDAFRTLVAKYHGEGLYDIDMRDATATELDEAAQCERFFQDDDCTDDDGNDIEPERWTLLEEVRRAEKVPQILGCSEN